MHGRIVAKQDGTLIPKRAVQIGSIVWSVGGFAVAAASMPAVNADARVIVGLASVAFPVCAAVAAIAAARHHLRTAGLLLLLSVATPTYFAWVINVPALLVGTALLVSPRLTVRESPSALSQP